MQIIKKLYNKYFKVHTIYVKRSYEQIGLGYFKYIDPVKYNLGVFYIVKIRNGKILTEKQITEKEYIDGKKE